MNVHNGWLNHPCYSFGEAKTLGNLVRASSAGDREGAVSKVVRIGFEVGFE